MTGAILTTDRKKSGGWYSNPSQMEMRFLSTLNRVYTCFRYENICDDTIFILFRKSRYFLLPHPLVL